MISSVLAGQNWAPLLVHLLQPQNDTEQKEKKMPFSSVTVQIFSWMLQNLEGTCTFHLIHFSLLTEVPVA